MDILIKLGRNNAFYALFLMLFLLPISLFSQTPPLSNARLTRCGIIFKSDYPLPFEVNVKERFTPSDGDVKAGEAILSKLSKFKLRKFMRQYIGYIDSNGDSILVVNLLKDLGSKKNELYYKNWSNEFILGFGRIYEENTFLQRINLTTKQLESF
jgi:hypothetical protein